MKFYAKVIAVLSGIGTANALYLTVLFFRNRPHAGLPSVCDFSAEFSCTRVITSPYALFLGVPVCTIALVVYPALAALAIAALRCQRTRNLFYVASLLSAMGLTLNGVYVYNEAVHLGAACALCIACTVLIALDLAASIRGYQLSAN